jgi:hypothetical protein
MIGPSTTRAAGARSRITPTARWSAWSAAVALAACGAGEPSLADASEEPDVTPPVFDGLVSAAPVGAHAALLSWVAATDDVSPSELIRYRAYLATAPGGQDFSSAVIETVPGATEVLVDGLSLETSYFFVVRAVDAAGNEDANTVERSATTAASVSYAADVQPIFDASCAGAACHAGVMPSAGLDLRPAASYGQLVEVPAEQCASRLRVAPGAPDQSYLVDKIRGTNLCAGTRMPKDSSLSPAEIQLVVDWIAAGAQDD